MFLADERGVTRLRLFFSLFILFCLPAESARLCREVFLSNVEIERELIGGVVIKQDNLQDQLEKMNKIPSGTTEAYLLEFNSGMKAVFKPDQKAWTSHGELAAYKISEFLGLHAVPPTVIREVNGRVGSLQYFIETNIDLKKTSSGFERISQRQWSDANVFHYIIGQWDRHAGNFLIDKQDNLILIDNADMMMSVKWQYGELPWIKRSQKDEERLSVPFPYNNYFILENPSYKKLEEEFGSHLGKNSLKRIFENELDRYPNRNYPYIFWRGNLWTQRPSKYGKIWFTNPTPELIEKLKQLDAHVLLDLVGDLIPYTKRLEILERIDGALTQLSR